MLQGQDEGPGAFGTLKATQGGFEPPQRVLVKHFCSQRLRLFQWATGSTLGGAKYVCSRGPQ